MGVMEGEMAGWIIAIVFIILALIFLGMQFGSESPIIGSLHSILESRGGP